MKNHSELLMPAGSLLKLKTAILYGADAVYAGTPDLSLRTKSEFTLEELAVGIKYTHARQKRIYLTLNLYSHNKDIEKLPIFLNTIRELKPDGVIIADPGIFNYVKEQAPEIPLHISTQANVLSWLTILFWQKMGASLCVLGREVNFQELKEIRAKCPKIKLEVFVHGAMCMAHSGRCLISNFLSERGANQGNCAHSCRWNYKLHMRLKDGSIKELVITDENKELFEMLMEEEYRPGEFLPILETEEGAYFFNAKDLCLLPKLSQYLELGIDSLKVEGRHKTNYYVAMVTHAYRKAIDDWYQDPKNWSHQKYMPFLYSLQNRGYTLAFHEGRLTNMAQNYTNSKSISEYQFAGYIKEIKNDHLIFEVKNTLESGDAIEFISPGALEPIRVRLLYFIDSKDLTVSEKVSAGQEKSILIPKSLFKSIHADHIEKKLPLYTVARKEIVLQDQESSRLFIDQESYLRELSNMPFDRNQKAEILKNLAQSTTPELSTKSSNKKPKYGLQACCGKGCNGCLIYLYSSSPTLLFVLMLF